MKEVGKERFVFYMYAYSTIPILMGVITAIIFAIGAIVLNDTTYWAYLILSSGLIWMGYARLKKPYLTYSENKIQVNGIFGLPLITYNIENIRNIEIRNKRIYYQGSKLKFNAWFVNRYQYKMMLDFFNSEQDFSQHLHE